MPYVVPFANYVDIGGVPLNTPAWIHANLGDLLGYAAMRGENRVIPGAIGVRPLPRRVTETTRSVNLTFVGDVSWENVAHPDPVAGLFANLLHFMTNVVDPSPTNSVRTATLHLDGSTYATAVQVVGFEIIEQMSPAAVGASMDVNFVDGMFW